MGEVVEEEEREEKGGKQKIILKEVQKKRKQMETQSNSEVYDLSNEGYGPYLPMPEKDEVGK